LEKLKQLLAYVVDKIVVEGRDHIQPYFFVPGVLQCSLRGGEEEHCKNPNAAGQSVWVSARGWDRVT